MSIQKNCVQCGKRFTLNDSEISFYKAKKLSLPKRCKECREKNKSSHSKGSSQQYRSYYIKKGKPVRLTSVILAIALTILSVVLKAESNWVLCAAALSAVLIFNYIADLLRSKVFIQEFDTSPYRHSFYDTQSMVEHYVKHGKEIGCSSMEEYLAKANRVIDSPRSLSKQQKADGDTCYFIRSTNEFVVVAKAGYIRTYYIASEKYFNKQ